MRLLVVEDEPKSRRGLQRLCGELYRDCEVVAARNGEEALRAMERAPVDILLTDICMPTMDGIMLMECTRERGLSPEIIVLSAHREFEYAQKALKLGAMDYLLKPVSRAEMQRVFDQAFLRIRGRNAASIEAEQMRDQLNKAIPTYINHLMGSWVKNTLPTNQLHEVEEIFPIRQPGQLMMCRIHSESGHTVSSANELLRELRAVIDARLGLKGQVLSFATDCDGGQCIVTVLSGDAVLSDADQQVLTDWAQAHDASIVLTMSDPMASLSEHVLLAWEQAQQIERAWVVSKEPEGLISPRDVQVDEICEYIKSHLSQELTLGTIAAAFHYSSSYLSRIFNGHMGISLNEYITCVRIDRAREMLVTTDLHVYEIARKIGYSDVQYFHRVFRRRVGVTPDSFRRTRNARKGR